MTGVFSSRNNPAWSNPIGTKTIVQSMIPSSYSKLLRWSGLPRNRFKNDPQAMP